jgi:hypothetical protein
MWDGPDEFKGLQTSSLLDIEAPPLKQCKIRQKDKGLTICRDQDPVLLGARIIKEHRPTFQLQGSLTEDPVVSSWWTPYDKEEIMRYGHRLNTSIPPWAAEAEFPPEPCPDRIVVRVKSAAPMVTSPVASLADGPPSQPSPPGSWGRAQPGPSSVFDPPGTALSGYASPNSTLVDDFPPDPEALAELAHMRGFSGRDEDVHKAINWAFRKDKEVHVGIALEIAGPVREASHEITY